MTNKIKVSIEDPENDIKYVLNDTKIKLSVKKLNNYFDELELKGIN